MASVDRLERKERPPYIPTPDSQSYDEGTFKDLEKSLPVEKCADIPTLKDSTDVDDTPDGGLHAWLVLFGVSLFVYSISGYMSAWGVFQAYYENSILQDSSPSTIAWIGSIQQSFLYIPTLIFSRLLDMGYFRTMLTAASVVFIVATFLIAQCHVYWQFLLCQGLLTGVAAGVFSGPVIAILSQWFRKRRGLALGLYAAGASLGGTVLPITAKALIPTIGFPWTIRVIALIIMFGLVLGNLTIKQRRSSSLVKGSLFDFSPMRSHAFLVYCFAAFFVYLGYYSFTTYVAALAIKIGVSTSFSFYLVSICNACSGVSRITSGLTADKTGAMNLMIPFLTLSVVIYCVWPFAHAEVALVFISILYGVSIGPFASLFSSPVLDLGEKDQLGRRIGILMSMVGVAMLVGAPITGAVDKSRGPVAMGFYTGPMMLIGTILMAIVRHMKIKSKPSYWSKI
ncbi:MFS general substrate transporter [Lentinula raphanica]|uniref:MFS general substrate transporter n=1 Tax=Lentinula raphanica TaxID=153919 RepID=A0AA38PA88_9AGAR|nr:MFS general substrate transporter [Lentinula raphanica]KAJ3839213.1 MFS general substrate transporter [Lentinula raphanica]